MKRAFALLAVLVVAVGSVAGAGALMGTTDQVGLVGDDSPAAYAASGTVHDATTIYLGSDLKVDRRGAAVALVAAQKGGANGVTITGDDDTRPAYDVLSSANKNETTYTLSSIQAKSTVDASQRLVELHYQSSNDLVVATTNGASEYVAAAEFARASGIPMIFADSKSDVNNFSSTADDLGVSTVYVASNAPDSVENASSNLGNVSSLDVSSPDDVVNNQSTNETVYYVDSYVDAATAQSTGMGDVVVTNGSAIPQNATYNANAMGIIVSNNVSSSLESDVNATHSSYKIIGARNTEELVGRLGLHSLNVTSPVVVSAPAGYAVDGRATTVRVPVRNLGFSTANNVTLQLESDSQINVTEGPQPTEENGTYTWNVDIIEANGTQMIEYTTKSESPSVPRVISYDDGSGTSFSGFSAFGDFPGSEDLFKFLTGFVATLASLREGISPVFITLLAVFGSGIALVVYVYSDSEPLGDKL